LNAETCKVNGKLVTCENTFSVAAEDDGRAIVSKPMSPEGSFKAVEALKLNASKSDPSDSFVY
jgi:hypothetical protein